MNAKQLKACTMNNIAVICNLKKSAADPDTDLVFFTILPNMQLMTPPAGYVLVAVDRTRNSALRAVSCRTSANYELAKISDLVPTGLVDTYKSTAVAYVRKSQFKDKIPVFAISLKD